MAHLVNENMLNNFINKIHSVCPTLIAGVIADKHGLPIASKIHPKLTISEQMLSLEAVAEGRQFINTKGLQKIIHNLSPDVKLMMLLKGQNDNRDMYKQLQEIILRENPI